jgi:hypothetical protein
MSIQAYAELLEKIADSTEWQQDLYNKTAEALKSIPRYPLVNEAANTLEELNAQSNFKTLIGSKGKPNPHEIKSLKDKLRLLSTTMLEEAKDYA